MDIIHGENIVASRKKLAELLSSIRQHPGRVTTFTAKRLTLAQLEAALGSQELFMEPKVLVIEELHSLPKSQRKTQLINMLSTNSGSTKIILWEKRSLTKTMLKKFSAASQHHFKLTKSLFKWLDSIGKSTTSLTHLDQTLAQEDAFLAFIMLCKRVSQLITVKAGGSVKSAPFVIAKLTKQASLFTLDELLTLHTTLFEWDRAAKQSQQSLSAKQLLQSISIRHLKGA